MSILESMEKLYFLRNLTHIKRYSGKELISQESVSDHVCEMNALALGLVPKLNKLMMKGHNHVPLDLKEVIYRISVHDLDESLYCDIPRPFKHHNKEVNDAINKTVGMLMDVNLSPELVADINGAKDWETREGVVVALLDTVQAGLKMSREILMGNYYMFNEINNVIDYLPEFKRKLCLSKFNESFISNLSEVIDEYIEYFKKIKNSRLLSK